MRDPHKLSPDQMLGLAKHMAAEPRDFSLEEAKALHRRCTRYSGPDEALAAWAAEALGPLLDDPGTPWGLALSAHVVPGQLGLFIPPGVMP